LPLYPTWTLKPPQNTPINASSELANGLVSFVPCNDGSNYPLDVVTGNRATYGGSGVAAQTWAATPSGIGFTSVLSTGQSLSVPFRTAIDCGQNLTVAFWFNYTSFQTGTPFISGIWNASNNTLFRLGDSTISPQSLEIVYNSTLKANSSTLAQLGMNCLVMTLSSPSPGVGNVSQTGYLNGVLVTTQSHAYVANSTTIPQLFTDGFTARRPGGQLLAYGVWNYALPANLIGEYFQASPGTIFATLFAPSKSYWLYHLHLRAGMAGLGCSSVMVAAGAVIHNASGVLTCGSVMVNTAGGVTHSAKASLICQSTLVDRGVTTHLGNAHLTSTSAISKATAYVDIVSSETNATNTTASTTVGVSYTVVNAGDLLILGFSGSAAGTYTVTDTKSNTWHAGTTVQNGTGVVAGFLWTLANAAGANTITLHSTTSVVMLISVLEFIVNTGLTCSLFSTSTSTGNSQSPTTGNLTFASPGRYILFGNMANNVGSSTDAFPSWNGNGQYDLVIGHDYYDQWDLALPSASPLAGTLTIFPSAVNWASSGGAFQLLKIDFGVANLTCTSTVNASGTVTRGGQTALTCKSGINGFASVTHAAKTNLTGQAAIIAQPTHFRSGISSVVCTAILNSAGVVTYNAKTNLTGQAAILAQPTHFRSGISNVVCSAVISGFASVTHHAKSNLTCTSVMGATGTSTLTSTAYATAILADGPIVWLRLAETSGTSFVDSQGNMPTGTWTSTTLNQPTLVPGDGAPGSVLFNGTTSNGQASTITAGKYTLTGFSVEAWFQPLNVTAASQEIIESSNNVIGDQDFFVILTNGTGIEFNCHDAANNLCQSRCVFSFTIGQIYHVVCTQTANTATIYIDGVSQTIVYGTQTITTNRTVSQISVGATGGGSFANFFNGYISDIAIYPTVLSATRVLAHYNAGLSTITLLGVANLGCQSVLGAKANVTRHAVASLSCNSAFACKGSVTHSAQARLVVQSVIGASEGTVHGGQARLTCQSTFTVKGTVTHSAQANLGCQSVLGAKANVTRHAVASLSCNSAFACKGSVTHSASSGLTCVSVLGGMGTSITHLDTANLTCNSVSNGIASVTHLGTANLTCNSVSNAGSTHTATAAATLVCNSVLTERPQGTHNANATLVCNSVLIGNPQLTIPTPTWTRNSAYKQYRKKSRNWVKPPLGSQIDWSHPLAEGLAACWLLNEQGGNQAFDLVGRLGIPLTGGATFGSASASNKTGYGLVMTGASALASATLPASLQLNGAISIVSKNVLISTPASYAGIFGAIISTSPNTCYFIQFNSTTGIPVAATNQAGSQISAIGVSVASGRFQVAATFPVYAPTTRSMFYYYNGQYEATQSVPGSPIAYTPSPTVTFGQANSGIICEFGLIYNTVLSPTSIAWLYEEPYAYIQSPISSRYFFLPAGTNANSALVCNSVLTESAQVTHNTRAALVCNSVLTAHPQVIHNTKATLVCNSVLTESAQATHNTRAALVCNSVLIEQSQVTHNAKTTLVCNSVLTGHPQATYNAHSALICNSVIIAHPQGYAVLVCNSILTAHPQATYNAHSALICNLVLTGHPQSTYNAHSALICNSVLTAHPQVIHNTKATLVCNSVLTAHPQVIHNTKATLVCNSVLTGSTRANYAAVSHLSNSTSLTSTPLIFHTGIMKLFSGAAVSAEAKSFYNARAIFVSTAVFTPTGKTNLYQSSIALLMLSDNALKDLFAANVPTTIIVPLGPVPPAPKPGYGGTYQPTWCNIGGSCDAGLCAITQQQQGIYLPPKSRNPKAWDSSIAQLT
jgi:hypothetical protein